MPTRAPRYCLKPGCHTLTTGAPRCPEHATQHERTDQRWRGTAHERGYTYAWSKPGGTRDRKLQRNPLCEYCERGAYGPERVTVATEVDHITPLDKGGTHDDDNLASACHSCHTTKTAHEHGRGAGVSERHGVGGENPCGRDQQNRSPSCFSRVHLGVLEFDSTETGQLHG